MKLSYKINLSLLVILAVTATAILGSGILVINSIIYDLNTRLINNELATIKQALTEDHDTLQKHGLLHVETYIQNTWQEIGLRYDHYIVAGIGRLIIFNASGEIINSQAECPHAEQLMPAIRDLVQKQPPALHPQPLTRELRVSGADHLIILDYVPAWKSPLVVALHKEDLFASRKVYIASVSISCLVIAALAMLIGSLLSRGFGRRIQQTLTAMTRVESGDLSVRLPTDRKSDELASLIKGLNRTFAALELQTQEKQHLQEQAVRTSQLATLGELAAGVAHEVNNPITGVINYTQILLNKTPDDHPHREILKRIIKEGERVAAIVKGLLAFARQDSEKKQLLSIDDILSDVLSLTSMRVTREGIKLDLQNAEQTPSVLGNPQQLIQLFMNLISNACYALNAKYPGFSPDKKLTITTETVHHSAGSDLKISVLDYGTGVPQDQLPLISKPFVTTKPVGEGTGLGLSISNSIVNNHGGKILFDSVEGEWTKVTVILPAESGRTKADPPYAE